MRFSEIPLLTVITSDNYNNHKDRLRIYIRKNNLDIFSILPQIYDGRVNSCKIVHKCNSANHSPGVYLYQNYLSFAQTQLNIPTIKTKGKDSLVKIASMFKCSVCGRREDRYYDCENPNDYVTEIGLNPNRKKYYVECSYEKYAKKKRLVFQSMRY